jgi:hypothetical protein
MTGASAPGARSSGGRGGVVPVVPPGVNTASGSLGGTGFSGHSHNKGDLWPRDFGRDGVSGLVSLDRALRARDVSRPDADDEREAVEVLQELLARVDGRRPVNAGRGQA